jgi:hypothetical protein
MDQLLAGGGGKKLTGGTVMSVSERKRDASTGPLDGEGRRPSEKGGLAKQKERSTGLKEKERGRNIFIFRKIVCNETITY